MDRFKKFAFSLLCFITTLTSVSVQADEIILGEDGSAQARVERKADGILLTVPSRELTSIWPHIPYPVTHYSVLIPSENCEVQMNTCATEGLVNISEHHVTHIAQRVGKVAYDLGITWEGDFLLRVTFTNSAGKSVTLMQRYAKIGHS